MSVAKLTLLKKTATTSTAAFVCAPFTVYGQNSEVTTDTYIHLQHIQQSSTKAWIWGTCSCYVEKGWCMLTLSKQTVLGTISIDWKFGEVWLGNSKSFHTTVKGKGFRYLLLSIGPWADPDEQAVSLQVVSHPPSSRLTLLSARPAAAEHHHPFTGTKLYCLVTEAHRGEQTY